MSAKESYEFAKLALPRRPASFHENLFAAWSMNGRWSWEQ